MNFKRLFRLMVCLVLVCCFLINASPIKAQASAAAGAAIAGASIVSVPVALVVTATLIALGVMKHAADTPGTNMHNLVSQVQSHWEAAGIYVQDGMVQLLRTVDEAGNAVYYAAADMMESVRSWLWDSAVVTSASQVLSSAE